MTSAMTGLRVRVPESALRRLKSRAASAGWEPPLYAEMILRYQWHEEGGGPGGEEAGGAQEEVYFFLELSAAFKERLAEQSGRRSVNLAAFGGGLIARYLRRFDRDPRDLRMIHEASRLVERKPGVSRAELRAVAQVCEPLSTGSLPAGFVSRWFHSRLKPLIRRIDEEGREEEFTVELMSAALERTVHRDPASGTQ